jgi:hypothetical protein
MRHFLGVPNYERVASHPDFFKPSEAFSCSPPRPYSMALDTDLFAEQCC